MDDEWEPSFADTSRSVSAGRGHCIPSSSSSINPVGKMASLSLGGAAAPVGGGKTASDDWGAGGDSDNWGAASNGAAKASGNGGGGGWASSSSGGGRGGGGGGGWGSSNGDDGWGSGGGGGGKGSSNGGGGWGSGGGGGGGFSGSGFDNGDNSFGDSQRRGRGRGFGGERGRGGRGGGGGRSCYKCGEEGHISRECPSASEGGSRGGFSGGGGRSEQGGSRSCYKCGEEGHISRECPSADSSDRGGGRGRGRGGFGGGGEGSRPSGCFNCGSQEHSVKDCDQEAKTRTTVGEDGKPREIYVPTETTDDGLFSEGISSGINFSRYQNIPCQVTGRDVVDPMSSFDESGLRPLLLQNIQRSGYRTPTPVQRYAIPIVMAGRDLMACAQTGSGKTAAFLLPILHQLLADSAPSASFSPCQHPRAVIVSPTRELAIQIHNEARKFGSQSALRSVVVYGGTSVQHQSTVLQRGCDVLVATPGRLLDFVDKGKVEFDQLRFLVLDEADRMLDMGFQGDVERITHHHSMPDKCERHTLLFSATFPEAIQRLAAQFLNEYLFVSVGVVGAASSDVVQTFCEVSHMEKRDRLQSLLSDIGGKKTLVFVEAKRVADFIASHLCQLGFATTSIHGDRLQREREEALADFKTGSTPTLVATSVASRGLDIKGVANVINYDLPKNIDDYVHRIGRTGRVGNIGNAISFYDSSCDAPLAADLVKILGDAQQEVPDYLLRDAGSGGMGGGAAANMGRSRDYRSGSGRGGYSGGNSNALPQGFNANAPTHLEEDESWN